MNVLTGIQTYTMLAGMKNLPLKQKQALQAVQKFWKKHAVSPSIQDIAEDLGVLRAAAYKHLKILKQKGYLEHQAGVARTWKLTKESSLFATVPLLGKVAAGVPILAAENIEDYIPVQNAEQAAQCFALRIKGHSMQEGGILDNDIVIVRQQSIARDGDIVVALVDGESATVKKFKRFTAQIGLIPMNQNYEPMFLDPERVFILGKVLEVRRFIA